MCSSDLGVGLGLGFFFKQKTAYEIVVSDWSSDVCSSDLPDQEDSDGRSRDSRPAEAERWQERERPGKRSM